MDQMQNTKHRTAWGLVICSLIIATSAWAEKVEVDKSKLLPSDLNQIELFEKSLADNLKENPNAPALPQNGLVPTGYRVQHHVVTLGSQQPVMTTKDVTQFNALNAHESAIAGEQVVYSNSLYGFGNLSELIFIRPGLGVEISDDIGAELVDACGLRRIRFAVNGGVVGGGGVFTILFKLVDGCPGSGGVQVPGTFKFLFGLDNNKDIIHVFDLVFPDKTCGGVIFNGISCNADFDCPTGDTCDDIPDVIIPPDFYMSLQFNTNDAGWLAGNPPERGFSEDSFYRGGFGCSTSLGGFPSEPHGSYYAVVSAEDTCETHYLAYQAVSHIAEAIEIGQGNRWAEDLTLALGDEACEISALEIGFRASGDQPYTVDVDLRGFADAQGLPGTAMQFTGEGGDKLEVARFRFQPGVLLPSETWVTFSPSRDGVGILRPGEAQAGSSLGTFRIIIDDGQGNISWSGHRCLNSSVIPESCMLSNPKPAIFYVRVHCRGDAPLGACCPSLKVPTVCEGGPTSGKSCESDQDCTGGQCMLVDRPCNDGPFDCPLGSQCLNTCSGGIHDGLTCYTDSDCVSAPSNAGTCVGAKICDKATCFDGVSVLGCTHGRWQALNAEGTNSCADNPFDPPCGSHACCLPDDSARDTSFEQCLRIKDPSSPIAECGRCLVSGSRCFSDSHCSTPSDSCIPDDTECPLGQICQDNGFCAPRTAIWHPGKFAEQDNFSCPFYTCSFGVNHCFEEQVEISCLDDDTAVFVCPDGTLCLNRSTCFAAGCDNPVCCDLVCERDSFCCEAVWDFICVEIAEELCPFIRPSNDECVCKTCGDGPVPCFSNDDCGFNVDGTPWICSADADVCSAKELIFTQAGTTNSCTPNSSSCRSYGEVNTARATNAPSDPAFCCSKSGTTFGDGTVWYSFIMPDVSGATSARFSTCRTLDPLATDSIIQVYKATDNTDIETACGSLVTIGCNDDAGGTCGVNGLLSDMCVDGLVPGETYYITLASPVSGAAGKYLLDVEVPCLLVDPPTSNDDCNDNDVLDVCDIANGEPDVDGNGVPDVCGCDLLQVVSWTSIGQHGPLCLYNPTCEGVEYGLDILADGSFSEPRSTGINKIIIAYDVPVDISSAAVSVSGCDVNGNPQNLSDITMSVVDGANTNEVVVLFSPSLPGNNPLLGDTPVKYDITISGIDCFIGGSPIADETRTAWSIFGDSNNSTLIVTNGDLGYVRAARDEILSRPAMPHVLPDSPTGVYEIRADINNDNTVSNGDLNLVRLIRDGIVQPSGKCP